MPYIEPEQRQVVNAIVLELASLINSTDLESKRDGVLNYVISCLIRELYRTSYTDLNAAIGVLECAKQELYRRKLAPYEDEKIKENGDVY